MPLVMSAAPTDHERRFISSLYKLVPNGNHTARDRAALATLRRGLGRPPGQATEMFPYVIPYCGNLGVSQQDNYFLVAALFALHPGAPEHTDPRHRNLGASFRALSTKTESTSIERRFVALLSASREDLDHHLRQAVSLLKTHEVPVDWAQLLHDLGAWRSPWRIVQRRWASAYWGSPTPSEHESAKSTESTIVPHTDVPHTDGPTE